MKASAYGSAAGDLHAALPKRALAIQAPRRAACSTHCALRLPAKSGLNLAALPLRTNNAPPQCCGRIFARS
eukprot:IDg5337t1